MTQSQGVTLELTFAERSVLNIALHCYTPVTADDAVTLASLQRKVARTKCGEPGCSYCGDDSNYSYDD